VRAIAKGLILAFSTVAILMDFFSLSSDGYGKFLFNNGLLHLKSRPFHNFYSMFFNVWSRLCH
jgi:hypothetical protein